MRRAGRPGRTSFARAVVVALALAAAGCSAEFDWRTFSWPEGGFAVLLPGKPAKQTRDVRIGIHTLSVTMFPMQLDGVALGVGYADLPPGLDAAGREALLGAARDQLVANIKGTTTLDRPIALDGFPGREFAAEGLVKERAHALAGRVFATDRRFYQILVIGTRERVAAADPTLFLGSFKLVR